MKRWLTVLICVTFLTPVLAIAQQSDPATREDVQQMFDLTRSRTQIESYRTVMKQQVPALSETIIKQQIPNATAEELGELNAFTGNMLDKLFQTMPIDEVMQAMVPAYQHHFTHTEIQELIQFYSSPLGQKIIAEMPALMAEGMQAAMPVMQKWMNTQMTYLKASAEDYAKTLKKEEKKTPAAHRVNPAS